MGNRREIVYIDTMIVFEAHRTNCWASLTGRYDIRTVPKVMEESLRGRKDRAGFIFVPVASFPISIGKERTFAGKRSSLILH